jgi:hypothetical protein
VGGKSFRGARVTDVVAHNDVAVQYVVSGFEMRARIFEREFLLRNDGKLPSLPVAMIKTQIQIPEHLYDETKRIASDFEMSFAEVVRRGIERIVAEYRPRAKVKNWRPPKPRDLGWRPLTAAQLKQLAQDEDPKL